MKLASVLLLLAAAAWGQSEPATTGPVRADIAAIEKAFDGKVRKVSATDPVEVMSSAQGVYLEGFGAVFTAQLDLIMTPTINPFRQKMSKQEVARVRARKLERLPVVKSLMREMLKQTARALSSMPEEERVVIAVSLFHFNWEDTSGLPAQIVMQAQKQKLLAQASADNAIEVQEY
jgi:uncharacterized membrane protein